mgnify:CR=1 FL=1
MDVEGRDLYKEMCHDRIVIEYLKDIAIAREFYQSLCNVDWYPKNPPLTEDEQIIKKLKGEHEPSWSCSWRTAGGFIADIRNKHYNTAEGYMDFYCSGEEGVVTDLVNNCFDRMGWYPKNHLNEK